jgi:Fe-S-cluster formation regulator IscX/YfhJ
MSFCKTSLLNLICGNIRYRLSDPEDDCGDVRFEEIHKAVQDLDYHQRCCVFAQYGLDCTEGEKDWDNFDFVVKYSNIGIKKAVSEMQMAGNSVEIGEEILEYILMMWIPYSNDLDF